MTNDPNPFAPPEGDDFLRDAMEYRDHFEDDEEFQEALARWPVCPICGRRRLTRCPVCKTAGDLFPLGDEEYWDGTEPVVNAPLPPRNELLRRSGAHGCGCHSGGCHDNGPKEVSAKDSASPEGDSEVGPETPAPTYYVPPVDSDNQLFWGMPDLRKNPLPQLHELPPISIESTDAFREAEIDNSADGGENGGENGGEHGGENGGENGGESDPRSDSGEVRLVLCYVCDEPFVPKFPARCEWCGHHFDSTGQESASLQGEDQDAPSIDDEVVAHYRKAEEDGDSMNPRIALVLIGMVLLFLGFALYCWWLFR